MSWLRTERQGHNKANNFNHLNTHHEFRFDQEFFVSSPNWNVLLHQEEVVEAAQQQATAINP